MQWLISQESPDCWIWERWPAQQSETWWNMFFSSKTTMRSTASCLFEDYYSERLARGIGEAQEGYSSKVLTKGALQTFKFSIFLNQTPKESLASLASLNYMVSSQMFERKTWDVAWCQNSPVLRFPALCPDIPVLGKNEHITEVPYTENYEAIYVLRCVE